MDKHSARKIEKRRRGGKVRNRVPFLAALLLAAQLCAPAFGRATVRAGGELRPRTPRTAAMAGSGAALEGNILCNPALLAGMPSGGLLHWTPSRFGLTELGDASAAWVQPFEGATGRFALQHTGFDAYRELRAEAAAGLRAGPRLRIGVAAAATHVSMLRYGAGLAWGADVGIALRLAPGLCCAAVAENALQRSFAEDERLPLRLRMGLAWESGGLRVAADIEKEIRCALSSRLGVEYAFEDRLFLRAGVGTAPGEGTGGFGLRTGGWEIGYAVAVHPDLGWTHTAGIGFQP